MALIKITPDFLSNISLELTALKNEYSDILNKTYMISKLFSCDDGIQITNTFHDKLSICLEFVELLEGYIALINESVSCCNEPEICLKNFEFVG